MGARDDKIATKPERDQRCEKRVTEKKLETMATSTAEPQQGGSKQGKNIPTFLFLFSDLQGLSLADAQIEARRSRIQASYSWGSGQGRER